jgi:choline dehydrogenase-like flavoprotein
MPVATKVYCVVGSGPAGIACASALLRNGVQVRLVDAGLTLEQQRLEVLRRLAKAQPAEWAREDVAILKAGTVAGAKGIPLKLAYGSDFPYREADVHLRTNDTGVGVQASLARGGFSNVWGAAMLPYVDRDLAGWPIRAADLGEHYREVLKLTGCSARRDDLEKLFPLYLDQPLALKLSRQAAALVGRMEQNRTALAARSFYFGQARLAVRVQREEEKAGCIYCGLCMYGCPYGCIYNSSATLSQLSTAPGFSYQPDFVATFVSESETGAVVSGYDRVTQAPLQIEVDRIYLAAGVIPTAQILLRSRALFDSPVFLKDSQYFLLPLVQFKSAGPVREEALQTLSQLFIEILDAQISPYTVHLQVYSYNELISHALARTFGPLSRPLGMLRRSLEDRLLVVQGYLHSDHSSKISLTLKKGSSGNNDQIELMPVINPQVQPTIRRVVHKLLGLAPKLGAMPLPMMLQIAEPGRGFHCGGSFPMSQSPQQGETDILGRPFGWKRIHVVDASVLPSIPATTITLSAMANAHRIACAAAS